ncbi:hypothetical protein DXG01_015342 [Tephrocybe rancida]|nr:hypothetical protein DXG01_015342 [Tephrocybe rancida]
MLDDVEKQEPVEVFTPEVMHQYCAYRQLARIVPFLDDTMKNGSEDEIAWMGRMIQRGTMRANRDDIKALKVEILKWIAPSGQLHPPLRPGVKVNRGFHHSVRYALSSSTVFFTKDTHSGSQRFYESTMKFFDIYKEDGRLQDILAWWQTSVPSSFFAWRYQTSLQWL